MNVLAVGLAVSLYFSLVAGNGLWNSIGQPKWPTWKEHHYGTEVFLWHGAGLFTSAFHSRHSAGPLLYRDVKFDVWAVNDPTDSVLNMVEPRLFH